MLPDRYAAIRKLLIQLKSCNILLSAELSSVVQGALANLGLIEKQVEKSLSELNDIKPSKFNASISGDIDGLLGVLTELKARANGVMQ